MEEQRIDELRQQLKSLGYLDAGVDRFVLGAASEGRGPVAIAVRASVRVGLLGGILLGPAAALGVGARLPGLITGVRDALVLAIYLGVFFFAATAAAAFIASLVSPVFRRGGPRAAAWIFTAGSLAYLTLWWRNANAGFGWSAPVWTSFALLVAVAISLLLGHAVRIATLAVLVARSGGTGLPRVTARSWRVVAAGGAAAFAGASILLLTTVRTDGVPPPPQLAVVNSLAPIRLIALDGFDPATYERLRDRLPNLRSALGWRVVKLRPQDTADPARAWTTIATGVAPEMHGVHAIETRRVAGLRGAFTSGGRLQVVGIATDLLRLTQPALASSQDRRAKTLWEVAEQAGLRTAVVNWWATWPATAHGGVMITDRGVLRLEHGGALDNEIAPAPVYDALRAAWPAIRQRAGAAAASASSGLGDSNIAGILQRAAMLDATLVELLVALPASRRDLDVIYLPGLDIAQNSLLGASDPAAASSVASRIEALERYYTFLDGAIAPLLTDSDKVRVILITQPGRVRSSVGGLLAMATPSARLREAEGHETTGTQPLEVSRPTQPRPVDVAPTVLYALGLPLSRELAGMALPELFDRRMHDADRYVASYGRPFVTTALAAGKPLDRETIDRLRSLGYIK